MKQVAIIDVAAPRSTIELLRWRLRRWRRRKDRKWPPMNQTERILKGGREEIAAEICQLGGFSADSRRILGGFSADWDEGGAGVVWAAGREMAVNSVRVSLPH